MMTTRTHRIVVLEVFLSPMDLMPCFDVLEVVKDKRNIKECER